MEKKAKDTLKLVLSILLAGVLLFFSFRNVNWKDFAACLKTCSWEYIVLGMVAGALAQYVRGWRWRMILRPIDDSIPFYASFNGINICMITNIVFPRVGELIRCGFITKHSKKGEDGRKLASFDKVFGTVLVERGWDIVFCAVLIVLMIVLMRERFGYFFSDTLGGSLSEKMSIWWIVVLVVLVLAGLVWAVRRFKDRNRFCGKVYETLQGIGTGLKTSLHMEKGWLFIVYTVLVWICYWMEVYFVLVAVKGIDPATLSPDMAAPLATLQDLGLVDALFLMFAGSVSSLVPVPGGFGAYHSVVAGALLSVYGIPFGLGIIFATLAHESQAVMWIITGIGSYIHEAFHK